MTNRKELELEELKNVTGGVRCDAASYFMNINQVEFKHQINEQIELELDYFIATGSTRCVIRNRGVGQVDKGDAGAIGYVPIYWLETLNRERCKFDGWYPEKCFKEDYTNRVLPIKQELY